MSPRSPVRAGDEQLVGLRRGFDGGGDAVEHEVVAVARRGDCDPRGVPAAAGTGDAPRTDDLAGDDPGQDPGPQLGRPTARRPRPRRRWWARGGPATPAGPSPRRRSRDRATPAPLRLPPPSASGTSSDVHPSSAPRAHQLRSKPSAVSASARTAVSGASCSRNLRVVSWKNCWSSVRREVHRRRA